MTAPVAGPAAAVPAVEERPGLEVGLGLWSMRRTVYRPSSWTALYANLRTDAVLAEELGYDGLWLAEHHFWYDGWCPQPLVAAASALAVTDRLRVGTAMHLLPQHDASVTSGDVGELLDLGGGRLDLGVSIGYRDEEFDGVGLARSARGRRMDAHLDRLLAEHRWDGRGGPALWVGGIAETAVRRAGQRGLSLLLPNTMRDTEIASRAEAAAREATASGRAPGRVAMLVDVWLTADPIEAGSIRVTIGSRFREYTGAWFLLQGEPAFRRPDLLDRQETRTSRAALVGPPETVAAGLLGLHRCGVDLAVLQLGADPDPARYRSMMREVAREVLPALRAA